MKLFILTILLLPLTILTGVTALAQTDIYKKDIISIKIKEQAGKMEDTSVTNDELEIDVFVRNFSIEKAKKVCAFYKSFYMEKAKKLNNRLTIKISVWSKKLLPGELDNITLLNKYYHGGINYNYYNNNYFEEIY